MNVFKVNGCAVRFNADEQAEVNAQDLKNSADPNLQVLAQLDEPVGQGDVQTVGNGDGWVSQDELSQSTGLYVSSHYAFQDMVRTAKQLAFAPTSTQALRETAKRGASPALAAAPVSLKTRTEDLSQLPRVAFVPLAEHLARCLAKADAYDTRSGPVHHVSAGDLVQRYDVHEIAAACAIITSREAMELSLTCDANGHHHLVQGQPDRVELDARITGLDCVFHTHPASGEVNAQPSRGDVVALRLDPNHMGGVVSEDGIWVQYAGNAQGGVDIQMPRRLWRQSK